MSAPLSVLLVDDEALALDRLAILLGRQPGVTVVGATRDPMAAAGLVEALKPDLCLLDIGMPELDGMALAKALAQVAAPPRIVFVTAYDSFAVAAFDMDAVDYLVKPVDPERLARALARVRARPVAPPATDAQASERISEFWASDRSGLTRIAADQVDRITAERDYMRLHVGRRSWLINDSLTRLEERLDPALFVRLHRGAIIRRDFVGGLRHDGHGWFARLADGSEQKVGRAYADNARRLAQSGRG